MLTPDSTMPPTRPNPTLPDDLISQILVRVPVKSLLCFQSVSKTWLSLIKHPAFVKSQLRHALTTQTHLALITNRYKFSLLNAHSREIVAYPKFPFRGEMKSVFCYKLLGSVNGIVCVVVKNSIYLWNPAIRQYKLIPSYNVCRDIQPFRDEEAFGFGYDELDHDFKVVRFVRVGSPPSFHGEVYSANTNVWRKLPDPTNIPDAYFDMSFNGFLCGIGDNGMLAFDLNKEVLNCDIKLPFVSVDAFHKPRVIEFKKSIVVVVLVEDKLNDDRKIKMWMLDNDACLGGVGVEASWTPLFVTSLDRPGMIVHGFLSNRDILLMVIDDHYGYVWISCNVDKKEAEFVPLSIDMKKHGFGSNIYKHAESLVTVPGFRQVNWNDDDDDDIDDDK